MKTSTALGIAVGALLISSVTILIEVWLLGLILPWFGVSLTFWQNFAIIALVNMIFNNFGVSSK
jgi:hypothetical protein